ncbi:hypothetical protein SAMN04488029_1983 [Reichenbachiella faecimaris]|uniref:Right handed beta helix region n=1 Tax=Reichenbachiella faecimaris TaxID=692418 RepID=A0A1W2GDQ6_REIFA|nr:hypothetical protein SAMN04488029_1983 [Reichenbachiella faecimaris]
MLTVLLPWVFLGCEPSVEELSTDNALQLSYSTDTVTFDTLFSSVGSITKRFKIYNTHDKAIKLNQLSLGSREVSSYSITVNGVKGKSFQDETIFGEDSLLVLVEVLIDPNNQDLPFLVKDSVVVTYNDRSENIKLVSWGQDAIFINNEAIPCDAIWTKDRPYVIYDSAWVESGCQLTVEAGTKIYIDNDAFFTIAGTLHLQGTAEEKILIANTRLDPKYEVAPGQWGSLFFFPGSTGNMIDHSIIKNGTNGVLLAVDLNSGNGAELLINNTSIQHMSESGIAAFAGNVTAQNLEIFNCQNQLIAGLGGGSYSLNHCTFSNTPNEFTREGASVGFTNYLEFSNGSQFANDLSIEITNSIIWGREEEELAIDLSANTATDVQIENNIIKSEQDAWVELGNFISQEENYPGFYSPNLFNYQIDSLSNARDKASTTSITHDLLGTLRDAMPDIGAYERKDSIP